MEMNQTDKDFDINKLNDYVIVMKKLFEKGLRSGYVLEDTPIMIETLNVMKTCIDAIDRLQKFKNQQRHIQETIMKSEIENKQ